MSGWTMPIRQASYKGVKFDVISVDDSFERSIVEHAYPFINGADLEDMGLNAQTVRMQAVMFGEGYYIDYKKFLSMLQDKVASTLTHPVRGRMPNMLLVSANLRHDAENVNYVALDLTFREATEMQPLFVFGSSLLSRIDAFLSAMEAVIADATEWWASFMEGVAFGKNVLKRMQSMWSAIAYTVEQIESLFLLNTANLPAGTNQNSFLKESKNAFKAIEQAFSALGEQYTKTATDAQGKQSKQGEQGANLYLLGGRGTFEALARALNEALRIPHLLATKQTQRITSAAQFFKQQQTQQDFLNARFQPEDLATLTCTLQLMCAIQLAKCAALVIEEHSEEMTPTDIEYVTNEARKHILASLNLVRQSQHLAQNADNLDEPNNGRYTSGYLLAEQLRHIASELLKIAISAINQKPPLTIREVKETGTLVQIAHFFYGDYERADELLRLNPQITQPNYIAQGTLLNCYTE